MNQENLRGNFCRTVTVQITLQNKKLTLTGRFLKGTDSVCRVHGGGFAGVIMCILPVKDVYSYKDYMEHIFGKGNVYVASIRNYGAVKVELV